MTDLRSAPAQVKLIKAFTTPFDNAIATARTCYSSRLIYDEDVRKDEKSMALRDSIAKSTYQAGHHTTLQHSHFQFAIDGISRHAIWAFFHAHPFYNSEQVSQRYVEVKPERVYAPQLGDEVAQNRYTKACHRQMAVYQELLSLLLPAATQSYFSVYPGRKKKRRRQKMGRRNQKTLPRSCSLRLASRNTCAPLSYNFWPHPASLSSSRPKRRLPWGTEVCD